MVRSSKAARTATCSPREGLRCARFGAAACLPSPGTSHGHEMPVERRTSLAFGRCMHVFVVACLIVLWLPALLNAAEPVGSATKSSPPKPASALPAVSPKPAVATLDQLKLWTNPDFTRLVLNLSSLTGPNAVEVKGSFVERGANPAGTGTGTGAASSKGEASASGGLPSGKPSETVSPIRPDSVSPSNPQTMSSGSPVAGSPGGPEAAPVSNPAPLIAANTGLLSELSLELKNVVMGAAFRKTLTPVTLASGGGAYELADKGGLLERLQLRELKNNRLELHLWIRPLKTWNITRFDDQNRLLVDLFGKEVTEQVADDASDPLASLLGDLSHPRYRMAPLRVVVDPGHGGTDPGAKGPTGTMEKDVTLAIALKLRDRLKSIPGVEVLMTRDTDVFIPLQDRTRLANENNADLFISLHANASPRADRYGLETYYLDNASDEAAAKVAASENESMKDRGGLDFILQDLVVGGNVEYSRRLAHSIHDAMWQMLQGHYPAKSVKNLGIKTALFYVLFGARMPSILLETAFISNAGEEIRLTDAAFQDQVADSVLDGIGRYVQEARAMSPMRQVSPPVPEKVAEQKAEGTITPSAAEPVPPVTPVAPAVPAEAAPAPSGEKANEPGN